MHVVPFQLPLISALSNLRIFIPPDLLPSEARQRILLAVQEMGNRFPQGLPKLNPVQDIRVQESEIVERVHQIEELKQKMFSHPMHKVVMAISSRSQAGAENQKIKKTSFSGVKPIMTHLLIFKWTSMVLLRTMVKALETYAAH